jgi:CDP-diacylglycerol--glycerol-3-phosphate 3-phosphatidyltransferase
LVTDVLDGFIARAFNMKTEIGARLDSIADMFTYGLAILGIFLFKKAEFAPHLVSFSLFIGLFVFSHLLSLVKFGRFPAFICIPGKWVGIFRGFSFSFCLSLIFRSGFIT